MSLILPIITVLLIYGIIYLVKNQNKDKILEEKTQQTISFEVKSGIEECFQKIQNYANTSKYTIESIDENSFSIMLGENITLTTNGFFFLIYLTFLDDSNTKVEVGIKSKTFQTGSLVNKSHQKFVDELKLHLYTNN